MGVSSTLVLTKLSVHSVGFRFRRSILKSEPNFFTVQLSFVNSVGFFGLNRTMVTTNAACCIPRLDFED